MLCSNYKQSGKKSRQSKSQKSSRMSQYFEKSDKNQVYLQHQHYRETS